MLEVVPKKTSGKQVGNMVKVKAKCMEVGF